MIAHPMLLPLHVPGPGLYQRIPLSSGDPDPLVPPRWVSGHCALTGQPSLDSKLWEGSRRGMLMGLFPTKFKLGIKYYFLPFSSSFPTSFPHLYVVCF